MINWIIPVTISADLWVAHMVFVKIALEKLSPPFFVFALYLFALTTMLSVLLLTRTAMKWDILLADKRLLAIVAGAGISIGLVDYFFSKGLSISTPPPLSLYSPLFATIALTLTALIGVLLFHETVTPLRLTGFVLSCVGIFLLAR